MADSNFIRARELFVQACQLPSSQRENYVIDACGNDSTLRDLVLELLKSHAELPDDFLETRAPVLPEFLELMQKDGLLFGDFQVESMLGEGGAGIVYLAMQRSLGRHVALKVLRPVAESDMRSMSRFVDEAKSAARLSHSGIAQVFTAGSESGIPYFSMEFVPGTTLADCIRRLNEGKPAPPMPATNDQAFFRITAELIRDCADALTYAHAEKILHRDIKPDNILIDSNGKVKIVDFGLARDEQLGRHSKTGTIEGTPHYMSPEQARAAKNEIDERTDVYSLGVVLYELLALRRPFADGSLTEVLQRVASEEPPLVEDLNPRVPGDLAAVCHKAMRRSLTARYQSARELRNELQRFLDHVPTIARPASAFDRAERVVRMHRRKFIAGGLVVLGSAIGIGGSKWFNRGQGMARLSVSDRSVSGKRVDAEVRLRKIDWVTGEVGSAVPIGRTPLDNKLIAPGYYRVEIATAHHLHVYTRVAESDRHLDIVKVDLPQNDKSKRSEMAFLEGGQFEFKDGPPPFDNINAAIQPLWIDKTEVTNAQYLEFCQSTNRDTPQYFADLVSTEELDEFDLPVVFVSYLDALAYSEWIGKTLPTFLEWSRASRGFSSRVFPNETASMEASVVYGKFKAFVNDDWSGMLADYRANVKLVDASSENLDSTPEGVAQMYGNVAEWTSSVGYSPQEFPLDGTEDRLERISAGHAWFARSLQFPMDLSVYTGADPIDSRTGFRHIGFRCIQIKEK